jgi:hypothetical protein
MTFNVSMLDTDVMSASLVLQHSQYTGPYDSARLGVWPIADDWNELTVTWNTRPMSSGLPLSKQVLPMPMPGKPLVFPSTEGMVAYINSQRPAHGGDGVASFATGWYECPVISAPQLRNTSKENPLNLPPYLLLELSHQLYLPLIRRDS